MRTELLITGSSALTPYGLGVDAWMQGFRSAPPTFAPMDNAYQGNPELARVPDYDARKLLATRSISNFDRLTLHVCVAAAQLHEQMGMANPAQRQAALPDERISFVLGTSGPLQSVMDFDLQAIEEPRYVQPSIYPNVVFNVPASYAAIRHAIRGSCITLTDGETSSLQAFAVAAAQLESGRIDFALVGGAEEATPAYALYQQARAAASGSATRRLAEGAALLTLEREAHAQRNGREGYAGVFGCTHVFAPGDAHDGLAACLHKLRRRFGSQLDEVGVVCAEPTIDLARLGLGHARQTGLEARVGNTGALYGALATLNVLADDTVANGETILVMQGASDASCAAMLLQKHRGLLS